MRVARTLFALFCVTLSLFAQDVNDKREAVQVDLHALVHEVVRKNAKGLSELITLKTKQNELEAQNWIFEPVFKASFLESQQKAKTSAEDFYYTDLLSSGNVYESRSSNYEVGFSGLAPTGAQWSLSAIHNTLSSNVIESRTGNDSEYRGYVKLGVEQPLLKNAGYDITTIQKQVATVDAEISKNEYEKLATELVGVTIQSYWELYGAQKIEENLKELVVLTKKNYETVKHLANSGRIPQTEILEMENRLYMIELEKIEATDKLLEKRNQLFSLLNIPVLSYADMEFELLEPLSSSFEIPTLQKSLESSLNNWSEYQIAQKKLEVEMITQKYVHNQLLPELNLKADVTNQSLENQNRAAMENAFKDDYQSWSVGVNFSMPIFGNQKLQKHEENTKLKILKAKLELNSLEKNLQNSLHTRIEKLQSTKNQMELFAKGLEIKKGLLEIENKKLLHGKTNVKNLLELEEEYILYQKKMYQKVVEYKTAEAILQKVMGTLLASFNIEVKVNNLEEKIESDGLSDDLNFQTKGM
ncbi:MAG: TolC family protein [Sulfurimonas sp.]|nr:TolC family protein [Sulfurimonas sp.]MBU1216054.1 TolC family protein [bacterium]MBU1434360.1 TolC family protein [bacterium]MBU1501938.1 TolC family protein [bacterium]MBU3939569.1 TolC family protein [bacterium]